MPHGNSGPEKTCALQIPYLQSAIADSQGTLRAIDAKLNTLMALQLAPVPLILGAYKFSYVYTNKIGKPWFVAAVIFFMLVWLSTVLTCLVGLIARNSNRSLLEVNGYEPMQTYFPAPGYFNKGPDGITRILMKKFLSSLPQGGSECVVELSAELLKLSFIRDRKMENQRWVTRLSIVWVCLGIVGVLVYACLVIGPVG